MQAKLNIAFFPVLLIVILFLTDSVMAANDQGVYTISGYVFDGESREPLTGATLVIQHSNFFAISGLDGSYSIRNVPAGDYLLEIAFISYETIVTEIKVEKNLKLDFDLETVSFSLGTVEVVAVKVASTEASARSAERNALNSINAISAAAIELSPDQTVANVVQRVSGLTVERGNSGDAQYAIVRGMDKRYNYTLVNGIKIPSPDNENRYVPLDIFPAELLDQLVVSKSLTPSMEGDAIGGVVDMIMKSAHSRRMVSANVSTGYSEIFLNRDYDYFNAAAVDRASPMQRVPEGERVATMEYYSTDNFNYEKIKPNPNLSASLSLGDRYFNERLGIIVAATFQNAYRGSDRTQFGISETTRGFDNMPRVSRYQQRRYSTHQERIGVHNKMDYIINSNHNISLYNVWLHLQNNESRVVWEDGLRALDFPTLENNFRGQVNIQRIYNSTLQGEHRLASSIRFDWSLVYSYAMQNMPDNSQLITVSNYDTPNKELRWLIHENNIRIWEKNDDRDYAVYYNLSYSPRLFSRDVEFKTGGLYRMKQRSNFFDMYSFKPNPGIQEYIPYITDFADLSWRITGGAGTPSHVLNYDSYENIFAQYLQFNFPVGNVDVLGGVRAEHTDQGYETGSDLVEDGNQEYWKLLPSLHLKYTLGRHTHIRASYFKSLSRPSFLEIVPYRRPSTEDIIARGGNATLQPVEAHNFDMRFEYYPSATDQFLVGLFYKTILNPIETAVLPPTDPNFPENFPANTTMMPVNFETAINQGIELDFIRYFNRFGIRANYTFTLSSIESVKRTWTQITDSNYDQLSPLQQQELSVGDSTFLNVIQVRPLQGQSRHLGNLSLLFKDQRMGIDAQLAAVYTGERIAVVSTGYETDWWQKGFVQLDFSAEKRFAESFTAFIKVNNILNTPYKMVIKKPHIPSSRLSELQPNGSAETLVREEFYNRIFMIGLKFNL